MRRLARSVLALAVVLALALWTGQAVNAIPRSTAYEGLAVCLALALFGSYVLMAQTRRGVPLGYCPACGYDLRASSERCPECGTAMKEAAG